MILAGALQASAIAIAAPTVADVAAFDARLASLEAVLDAARDGDTARLNALSAEGAKASIEFSDRPFTVETFREFKENCAFNREATAAYDQHKGLHFFYDCKGFAWKRWSFNIWIENGKVTKIKAYGLPPGA